MWAATEGSTPASQESAQDSNAGGDESAQDSNAGGDGVEAADQ